MQNPSKVAEGIFNSVKQEYGLLSEEEQNEIAKRRLLCQSCPNMSANKKGAKQKGFDYCTLCSCPIATKTASLSSNCGAVTYNERHPEAPEPVLWEKYTK